MVREDWMHKVANLAQCVVGCVLADPQPHRAARALLAKAPPPVTRLEEILLYGLLFEAAVGVWAAHAGGYPHESSSRPCAGFCRGHHRDEP